MDDTRIEWIRNKIYDGLRITDVDIFEFFLTTSEGVNENKLLEFLNTAVVGEGKSVVFYVTEEEEEVEEEVEIGIVCIIAMFEMRENIH